jgi:hypothetical protein
VVWCGVVWLVVDRIAKVRIGYIASSVSQKRLKKGRKNGK